MTTHYDTDEGQHSRRRVVALNLSEQAQAHAQSRLAHYDPETTSQADRDDVQAAAERFVVSTEKDGPYAHHDYHAKSAGAAHLKMRLREDFEQTLSEKPWTHATEAFGDVLSRIEGHFRRAVDAYHKQLTILEPVDDRWAAIEQLYADSSVAFVDLFCPRCARQQRRIEESVGIRWPEPHEHAAETAEHGVTIRELREVPEGAHCSLCNTYHVGMAEEAR